MKNKSKWSLTLLVIIIILLSIGFVYIITNKSKFISNNIIDNPTQENQEKNPNINNVIKSNNSNITIIENKTNNTICYNSLKYFIITRPSGVDVNDDYLIKYKTSDDQIIPCEYSVETTDFEIKDVANGFIAEENNFLIIESGSGPDGTYLMVYDLNTRKKIYGDENTGVKSIKNNTLIYWRPNYDSMYKVPEVTKENCLEFTDVYDEYLTKQLGFIMNSLISVNLTDLTKKELGEYHCSVTQ